MDVSKALNKSKFVTNFLSLYNFDKPFMILRVWFGMSVDVELSTVNIVDASWIEQMAGKLKENTI